MNNTSLVERAASLLRRLPDWQDSRKLEKALGRPLNRNERRALSMAMQSKRYPSALAAASSRLHRALADAASLKHGTKGGDAGLIGGKVVHCGRRRERDYPKPKGAARVMANPVRDDSAVKPIRLYSELGRNGKVAPLPNRWSEFAGGYSGIGDDTATLRKRIRQTIGPRILEKPESMDKKR